jgi:nicotinate-nucleotide--dimethylbenzimidazole phosphoribosyltransferase
MSRLADTIAAIAPADSRAAEQVRAALDAKTKPRRSLGRLEELAVRIAGACGDPCPSAPSSAIVVAAADHGVAAEGVSAYPQEVTVQMLANFAAGGAAVSVLAREAGARLVVVDVGVRDAPPIDGVLRRRVANATANATRGPAMTRGQADRAIELGIELANELADEGRDLVVLGEMGIANSTAAAALCCRLTGARPQAACGRGTGLDDRGYERKVDVVARILAANPAPGEDPLAALAAVGGLEIAALTGVALGAASRRMVIVLDGFISSVAALAAARLAPASASAMIAAHRSPEPGHTLVLDALGLEPLLDLSMRLGEGSGGALCLPLISAALAILREMATFDQAQVSDSGA